MGNVPLEAFAATGFNERFSGRRPRQDVKFDGSVEAQVLVLPRFSITLKMGTESFPETSENVRILMRLVRPKRF
jgi:hypothetical protein